MRSEAEISHRLNFDVCQLKLLIIDFADSEDEADSACQAGDVCQGGTSWSR